MKIKKLKKVEHSIRIGKRCEYMPPTITESCLLEDNGEIIGFYLTELPEKLKQFITIANKEFMSDNVPKTLLERSDVMQTQRKLGITRSQAKKLCTVQMSTILGGVLAKPHLRRPYNSIATTHTHKTANTFIKAMLLACKESEKLIKKYMPNQYEKQKKIIEDNTLKIYRFGNLFTSSISNLNISAPFHQDHGNIKKTVNVIITKRRNSKGGCLHIPDYNATIEQADNSMLVYPAWRNMHGVTPIIPTKRGGYRNSLIFYPLKAFKKY